MPAGCASRAPRARRHSWCRGAQDVRDAYAEALAAQQAGLARLCAGGGFGLLRARTDHRPETALLALHQALGG